MGAATIKLLAVTAKPAVFQIRKRCECDASLVCVQAVQSKIGDTEAPRRYASMVVVGRAAHLHSVRQWSSSSARIAHARCYSTGARGHGNITHEGSSYCWALRSGSSPEHDTFSYAYAYEFCLVYADLR